MSAFGGFLGAYAVLNRSDFLGNAQTSNLIHLTLDILGRDTRQILLRLIAMGLYLCGTMFTVLIPMYTKWNIKFVSVLVDFLAVCILAVLPEHMNSVIALYPVFFAMAFQWNVFADICGYVSSTIFSTNNTRQMTISFTKYLFGGTSEDAKRGRFYAGVLLFYHVGVALSYFAWKEIGLKGVYIGVLPLMAEMVFIGYESGWIRQRKHFIARHRKEIN
jgi:uncharacterized membrane protein YoaK (UPF0700 family)